MIRHIVLLKVKAGINDDEVSAIFDELDRLRPEISGMRQVCAGRSTSPEKIERGYLHGFTVDFDSWDGLAQYQAHPAHKATGAKLVGISEGGLDGILVFDLVS